MIPKPVLPHQVTARLFAELDSFSNAAVAGSERAFRAITLHGATLPASILGRCRLFRLSYELWKTHGDACLRALDIRSKIWKLECGNLETQISPQMPASKDAAAGPRATYVNAGACVEKPFENPPENPRREEKIFETRTRSGRRTMREVIAASAHALGGQLTRYESDEDGEKVGGQLNARLRTIPALARLAGVPVAVVLDAIGTAFARLQLGDTTRELAAGWAAVERAAKQALGLAEEIRYAPERTRRSASASRRSAGTHAPGGGSDASAGSHASYVRHACLDEPVPAKGGRPESWGARMKAEIRRKQAERPALA